uniref:Subtilisin-like protease n=1 Tax=Aegilops tauschii TaxID=37682 RepID=M8BY17_AEGTA
MAMAMAPVALALCLCTTVFLSTPTPAQSYTGDPSSRPSPTTAAAEPTSSSEYTTYIILLKPADAQVMDDEARQVTRAGIIIGVIDSGIESNHPSFDDVGMSPPPARWKGTCKGMVRPVRCNNKLIGVRSFVDYNPADETGHGAHVAMYKACRPSGCLRSNLIRAIDTAVSDGVDVVNISLGRKPGLPLSRDVVAIGAFRAVAKGVVFVTSAGNDGPTVHRQERLAVGDHGGCRVGGPEARRRPCSGVGRPAGGRRGAGAGGQLDRLPTPPLPRLRPASSKISTTMARLKSCSSVRRKLVSPWLQGVRLLRRAGARRRRPQAQGLPQVPGFRGAGVKVNVDAQARIIKNLYDNGAAQVVLIGPEKAGFTLGFREYGSSVVQEPAAVGRKLKDYSKYPDSAAQVLFKGTQLGVGPSPTVIYFSGRGPSRGNPHILKPDILAPGLNILAAATATPDRGPFRFKSGTSMAAPHISGVVALLKSMHPDWSPAAIRSAIITTADDVDNEGSRIMNEKHEPASAFAVGAGHVNATRTVDPGLVYDLEVRDYAGYICHLFAKLDDDDDDYAVQDIIQDLNLNCKTVPPLSDVDLNYPSIVVPANTTVRRTLTNVGPAGEYTARLHTRKIVFHDVGLDFSPNSLSFSRLGEKLTFQVSHHGPELAEGFLIWESDTHTVQSPLVVVRS